MVRYLGLASHLADQVMGLPLGPLDDPAERFEPIGPDDLRPRAAATAGGHV